MPQAVTHLLIPLILAALYRDYYIKKTGKNFPLYYVFIAGLAGTLPDIDILFALILENKGFAYDSIHRQITHSLLMPILFLILAFASSKVKSFKLRKHSINLKSIFLALSFGIIIHIILDGLVSGLIHPFSPFSSYAFGLQLVNYIPGTTREVFMPLIDGILLVIWIIYLEVKHKISDFI